MFAAVSVNVAVRVWVAPSESTTWMGAENGAALVADGCVSLQVHVHGRTVWSRLGVDSEFGGNHDVSDCAAGVHHAVRRPSSLAHLVQCR